MMLETPAGWVDYIDLAQGIVISCDPTKQNMVELIEIFVQAGGKNEVRMTTGNSCNSTNVTEGNVS